MIDPRQFLEKNGAPVLFGAVFIEQVGLPIPALPWMLAVGALCAAHSFSLESALGTSVAACLIADGIWFYLGRFRGNQVLNLLCRISLEPDSCVRRTQNAFSRYGWRGIFIAKFVPGLNTMAPPLAGMSSLGAFRFFLIDTAGSLLYSGCIIFLGYVFSSQIDKVEASISSIGGSALCLIGALFLAYIGYKFFQRKRLLKELHMTKISPADLRKLQDAGKRPVILDMRSIEEWHRDPVLIEGAIHLTIDQVKERRHEIPPESEVVVYCSCPNDVTSARVALLLRRQGFTHVRPLLGGIDAWRDLKYPLIKNTAAQSG